MLSTVTVTDSNYDVAQKLLADRYDNKRVILREHLSVLFKAPCVEENDGRGLRKLMEHAHEERLAFQAMGFDMNEMADIFIVYIIVEKLDRESLKQWELANPGKEPQRYDQLYRFLQSRCQALEAADVMRDHNAFNLDGRNGPSSPSKGHNKSFNKGKSHSLSINQHNCYSCEEAHKVFHCPTFKGLGVDARRELVNHKKHASTTSNKAMFQNNVHRPQRVERVEPDTIRSYTRTRTIRSIRSLNPTMRML